MLMLEELSYLTECIVIEFPDKGTPIKVIPHAYTDLLVSLTGDAAIWILSKKREASAYHLKNPTNSQSVHAIKYINDDWYYLQWREGKYYTTPCA